MELKRVGRDSLMSHTEHLDPKRTSILMLLKSYVLRMTVSIASGKSS